jgi:exodeoxyribonuclease V alpha subunit
MSDKLAGAVDHVTFHNPENGFFVIRARVSGLFGQTTVVGRSPRIVAGEEFEATGTWKDDPEHGQQFQTETFTSRPPITREGLVKFLGSGLIKGIGPAYAKKIVDVFGERALKIIDESPAFLREIRGLGPRRIQEIRESWKQQKAVRDITFFLQTHGMGPTRAVRIYKTYGDKALELVRENPYRLATDIWGIGFPTADQLARNMGVPEHSPERARAVLRHVLKECADEGHCGYPEPALVERAQQLTLIPSDVLRSALAHLLNTKELYREERVTPEPWIYTKRLFFAEKTVAERLVALMKERHPLPTIDADKTIAEVEAKMGLELANEQREALREAMTKKVLVITGGPGVGKTTLVRGILEVFQANRLRVSLAAPTGRAARRLGESTGQSASTLHRLLEYDVRGPQRTREKPLDHDLLVVDEVSMVDIGLMDYLVQAVPDAGCLILVGDADQLPSVGPGAVLADLIRSGRLPVVHLTQIFRQAEESGIVRAAYRVQNGVVPESAPPDKLGDFYFIDAETPERVREIIVNLVQKRIPARFGLDPFRDVQILTPMNRGDLGVRQLNPMLQQVLNPPPLDEPEITRFETIYRIGDKVMQTANDYDKEVFNGDIGRVRRIDIEEQHLYVDFDGRSVRYDFDELDELTLAYALTIHKSQGSEYPAVVLALHTQHFVMLRRNLLYTAITRGRKLVVVVGNRRALEMAVQERDTRERYTALAARLRET